ncbi:MAG: cell division protein ZapD [Candidatus Thiodiazotropha lotti]|uniref:Cell division protein ZapD n=1 Tax=Candidatus Thiodiazotropha lotti TaxID=2792787 RepID=A0A9E4K8F8_9GAMM|nr:cell division protein ZapD [Candidatus Thiodiazotropha lotti]ODC00430.1 cell division protein ZapD [Candidatus Thiodiazotropha endoloripes]MCG7922841.1 cell division protein ZapD [Candidatus Thiodiazotropha lotti]MCG7928762.1 cell division protein ZapD [Candidatus Thiodiazotropha lotti]MCG7941185.1 cell division protein ZapD [Candidatus Thiodiazotropha lotti]
MTDQIHYEHPLNERIRTFLRLEHLFMQVDHFRPLADIWSNRAAIEGLLSIMSVFGRSDLKTEILKELERHVSNLERVRQQPGVNMEALGLVLDDLEQAIHQVYRMDGQIARNLRNNEFLTTIVQRSSIPGGGCNFDLPQYHRWLNQPHEVRQDQMSEWMHELHPVREAVVLLLNLVRGSNLPSEETAQQGFFQKSLEPSSPAQLVRVSLPRNTNVFTEISGNKHRFSIRFLESIDTGKPTQSKQDIPFQLTTCIF